MSATIPPPLPQPSLGEIHEAYSRGVDAGDEGSPSDANPYLRTGAHQKLVDAWDEGWRVGIELH